MAADVDYYRYRLAEELSAAQNSRSAAAEECHRKLAEAYSRKLATLQQEQAPSPVQLAA